MRPADTAEEAWAALLAAHRRMTPEQKLQRTMELPDVGIELAKAGLRERYPEADEREICLRAVRQRLGMELVGKVYGPCLDGV